MRLTTMLFFALAVAGCNSDTQAGDAGTTMDSGASDSGSGDAGAVDAGAVDAGTVDSGAVDSGAVDSGAVDSGAVDAGSGDAGADAGNLDGGPTDCMDAPTGPDRPSPSMCSTCRPPSGTSGGGVGGCASDAECGTGVNGRCLYGRFGTYCNYDECFEDGDCETNQLCVCDIGPGAQNLCLEAGCKTNEDCPGAHTCQTSLGSCGTYFPPMGYYCTTDADECGACAGTQDCRFNATLGHWACDSSMCAG